MKKWGSILLAAALCLALTGCGNKDEKAIQETVNGYFTALQGGSLEEAEAFCTTDYRDDTGIQATAHTFQEFQVDGEYGDLFRSERAAFVQQAVARIILKCNVKNAKVKGVTATVTVVGQKMDFDQIDLITDVDTQALVRSYIDKHDDELVRILVKEGTVALEQKVYNGIAPNLFSEMIGNLEKVGSTDFSFTLPLKLQGDQWLIDTLKK